MRQGSCLPAHRWMREALKVAFRDRSDVIETGGKRPANPPPLPAPQSTAPAILPARTNSEPGEREGGLGRRQVHRPGRCGPRARLTAKVAVSW